MNRTILIMFVKCTSVIWEIPTTTKAPRLETLQKLILVVIKAPNLGSALHKLLALHVFHGMDIHRPPRRRLLKLSIILAKNKDICLS